MRNVSVSIAFLLLITLPLAVQGTGVKAARNNNIHLDVGLVNGYFKDLGYSPLSYTSRGIVFASDYRRHLKTDNLLFFSANIQFCELNTAISELSASDHNNINLESGFLKNIPLNGSEFKFHLGGQFHSYIDIVSFEDEDAVTFYGLHSLDLAGRISWYISSRHSLSSTASLPLFGLLIRPPWSGWDMYILEHEDNRLPLFFRGKWTSLNDFFAVNLSIQYHFSISQQWGITAKYMLRYYRTNELETAIIPSGQFTVGTSFSF